MPYYIKSKQPEGRYRAGIQHTKEGRAFADKELTAKQLAAINADPVLVVKELTKEEYDALRGEEQEAMEEARKDAP